MWWIGAALAVLAGCSSAGAATSTTTTEAQGTFTLTSPVLQQDGALPVEYTCDGSSTTLSAQPSLPDPSTVSRDVLLTAIDGLVLGTVTLDVTYDRTGLTS